MKVKVFSWFMIFLLMLPNFSVFVQANEHSEGDDETVLVNFGESGVEYVLDDFGGAESGIVEDPTDTSNEVVEVVKSEGAASWAGTTFGQAPENTIQAIPFTESNTKMSVKVFSPKEGIEVRLKAEEKGDPTRSVETGAVTTTSNEWETLEFDFSNQSPGTEYLIYDYTFNMISIFFDFGNEGAGDTYYFDDLKFLGQAGSPSTGDGDQGNNDNTLFLIGGEESRELSVEPGTSAEADILPQSRETLTYEIDNVSGEYNGSGNTLANLYLNGLDIALDFVAKASYDFNGDGNWDRTEETPWLATDGNTESESYEEFTQEFTQNVTGDSYSEFTNGKIRVEVSLAIGGSDGELKVNAPDEASSIELPYSLSFDGSEPSDPSDPGDGDEPTDPTDSEHDWQLTWSDEFEGTELDTSKWKIDIGNGFYDGDEWIDGWGNNEKQSYQEDNVRVEDGRLILEAREETVSDEQGEYDYTSGKVLTDELFSQAYGRFEASMKLPEGQGYWPAFWMMPQDDIYGGWAASGEIDIMENRGSETDKVGAAIHYGDVWPFNTYSAAEYDFPEGQSTTEFNEYSIEWEPGEIRWYVNDELYSTKTEWGTANGEYPAPFDQEFYLILNLAVGGWYGGDPDGTTEFPGQVEVDYVRVYEDANADHPEPGQPTDPGDGDGEDPGDGDQEPLDPSKDWQEVGDNLIIDGTFEETTEFGDEQNSIVWNVFNLGDYEGWAGLADFSIENEELKATIQQVGWEWWHIQFMQDVTVPTGNYKVEFDMRSERDRNVSVELAGSESGIMEFNVGSSMETYEGYINVESAGDFRLMFGLGRGEDDPELAVPYDLFIDNVRLVEVVEGDGNGEDPGDGDGEDPGDGNGEDPGDGNGEDPVSLEELYHLIGDLEENGEIKKSASKQLMNSLNVAEKHYEGGRQKQAINHLERFLSTVDKNQMRNSSEEVKELLKNSGEQLIEEWS
ncbi:glycoside hydrolase family 16 protein [Salipaludibacillus daqingensis]|uniref:glycoside hydrolase family 16 protein n=1 Tax=Salipaludibacillus daqingensis TaxID=3041001 RepID=UPI002476EB9F|nr:glycoside hydrolase family 16 protein [Salipaludibacillus daqingensis]